MNFRIAFASLAAGLLLGSCTYEFPTPAAQPEGTSGGADFTKYIAVGNSITAGFMDGTLYNEGQESAYPVLVWKAMTKVNATTVNFLAPVVYGDSEIGYAATIPGVGHIGRLRFDDPSLSPLYDPAVPAEDACKSASFVPKPMLSDITPQQHFQHVDFSVSAIGNFGIPGIKVGGLLSKGTGIPGNVEFNPYYTRFASNPGTSTPLNDILFSQGTFFSLLIGSNDVLDYANSGGVKPLTDAAAFASQYEAVVRAICSSNAQVKGVLINLPDLTETPFFHVVTDQIAKTAIPLDAASATQLNGAYQLQGHNVGFTAGNSNRLLIETGTGQIRQFRPGKDRITYAFALDGQTSLLGTLPIMVCGQQVGVGKGMGIADFANTVNTPFGPVPKAYPIPNRYVLDEDELAQAKAAIALFNASIAKISTMEEFADKLAFADLYTAFNDMRAKGFKNEQGLVVITSSMSPGGGFSADGLHPNPKGHAWLANVVINAVNGRFGSNMPTYDIAKFRGNEFPVSQ